MQISCVSISWAIERKTRATWCVMKSEIGAVAGWCFTDLQLATHGRYFTVKQIAFVWQLLGFLVNQGLIYMLLRQQLQSWWVLYGRGSGQDISGRCLSTYSTKPTNKIKQQQKLVNQQNQGRFIQMIALVLSYSSIVSINFSKHFTLECVRSDIAK